jgi:hypothetical protein
MFAEEVENCIRLVREGDARGLSYRVIVGGTSSSPKVTLWCASGVLATYNATREQANELVAAHAADQRL